ncbi:hypothetical protein L0F63_003949 [Massospora cicadina]|nr:hypothetical protein L0F63_003949 [Massospora cicadina]
MAPEGGAPTLAPIFNATPHKVGKNKTIEEIYQKKMQLEHILLRLDTYIGSTKMNIQWLWIYDDTTDSLIEKDIQLIPCFFKIFDEIWDPTMSKIKVFIDLEQNLISVYNNGSEILVGIHKEEKVYIPKLIFGHLLTLSNYDDSEKKVVLGIMDMGPSCATSSAPRLHSDVPQEHTWANLEELTKRLVFKQVSELWEVGFVPSSLGQLQEASFINSI